MNATIVDVSTIMPIDHAEAMKLQTVEFERLLDLLRSLDPTNWSAQTDCADWDVLAMMQHVLGACEASIKMRENLHQMRAGRKYMKSGEGAMEAGISACQVRDRAELSPAALVERLTAAAPMAVKKRTKMPSAMRKAKMKVDAPVAEKWALGYLIDLIYLRDAWMHRVDVSRATGHELVLTPEHDGRILAEVVAEWVRRHGRAVTLELTGAAGATFVAGGADGEDAEQITLDAVEFCRTLAGRAEAAGLLTTIVPF